MRRSGRITSSARASWCRCCARPATRSRRTARPPSTASQAMVERGIFKMLLPKSIGGGELDPLTYTAVLEILAQRRRQHGVVPGPELGLLDDRALPLARDGDRGVRRAARHPRLGAGDAGRRQMRRGRGRLPRHRPLGLRHRQPARELARRALPGVRGGRQPAAGRRTAGRSPARCIVPKSEATIIDNWQVLGLRGTGSDSYELKDHFVPEARTAIRDNADERRENGAALPVHQRHDLRDELFARVDGHRARRLRRVYRDRAGQGAARRQGHAARKQRDPVARSRNARRS